MNHIEYSKKKVLGFFAKRRGCVKVLRLTERMGVCVCIPLKKEGGVGGEGGERRRRKKKLYQESLGAKEGNDKNGVR